MIWPAEIYRGVDRDLSLEHGPFHHNAEPRYRMAVVRGVGLSGSSLAPL